MYDKLAERGGERVLAGCFFLQFLVWCVKHVFPEFRLQWLVDEVRTNLPRELDFTHEAHNQERFAAMFSHLSFVKVRSSRCNLPPPSLPPSLPPALRFCHIEEQFSLSLPLFQAPQVYWELTTPRLLTMEFCEGAKVNNLEYIKANNISVDDVRMVTSC